jgi:hypothetical protein
MHSLLDLKLAGAINNDRLADAAAQGQRAARAARTGRKSRWSRATTVTKSPR